MSGTDAVSAPPLTRTSLSVPHAGPSGRIDASDSVSADLRSPFPRDPDFVEAAKQRLSLPSSVIHELRTPLTSIHGYAQVLQRNLANPGRADNALNVISRESVRLTEMLGLLSELSELESDLAAPETMAVEVRDIIEGLIFDVQRRDDGQHPFTLEGTGRARCAPELLSRALLHVLTNAVRYSGAGEPVMVSIGLNGSDVEITIRDRGIGVIPGDHERIFQPYVRGSNAREYGVRGLGLGLYIARESLRQMDGRIESGANEAGGTDITITVPRT